MPMLITFVINYLSSLISWTTPWLLPGGKKTVATLQKKRIENEVMNEADGNIDDVLHIDIIDLQIKMNQSNE